MLLGPHSLLTLRGQHTAVWASAAWVLCSATGGKAAVTRGNEAARPSSGQCLWRVHGVTHGAITQGALSCIQNPQMGRLREK